MKIIGFDTETCEGPPITFQFVHYDEPITQMDMIFLKRRNPSEVFLMYLDTLPNNGKRYFLFGHNLEFDVPSLFYDLWEKIFIHEEIDYKIGDWVLKGVFSNLVFLNLRNEKTKKLITIIDTFAFFPVTLERLEQIFELKTPKLTHPDGLGQKIFTEDDDKFIKYALRDAEITARVGKKIVDLHDFYGIPLTVSRAQFSSKIFRAKYVNQFIPLQPPQVVNGGWQAYHGGKNGFYVKPGIYRGVYGVDIISAYPHAMSTFPSFYHKKLYKQMRFTRKDGEEIGLFPEFGVYSLSGFVKECTYPVIFEKRTHEPMLPCFGDISNVWVTGFELNEALSSGEFFPREIFGYYYEDWEDPDDSPFALFATDFFEKKEKSTTPAMREFYKVILNSISGKLIETRKFNTECNFGYDCNLQKFSDEDIRKVGSMFNSFIAALVTGHTRARIHQMEHTLKSIHTSTDGIFCFEKPPESNGLGGQKIDFHGDLLLVRNKVYVGYVEEQEFDENKNPKYKNSLIFPEKYIKKYATHAFYGGVAALEELILKNQTNNIDTSYDFNHVNKVKESKIRNLVLNKFEKRKCEIKNVDFSRLLFYNN